VLLSAAAREARHMFITSRDAHQCFDAAAERQRRMLRMLHAQARLSDMRMAAARHSIFSRYDVYFAMFTRRRTYHDLPDMFTLIALRRVMPDVCRLPFR